MNKNGIWTVIVTFNSSQWITRCIKSIRSGTIDSHIVVVDNASEDDTVRIVKEFDSGIEIMKMTGNLGFGQACNAGMNHALASGAEYILQVNDDAFLQSSTLEILLGAMREYPEFGILIPLNLLENSTDVDPLFFLEMKKYCPNSFWIDTLSGKKQGIYQVPVLPGAVLLTRREFLKEVGGFDPLFFVQGVEYDFCLRAEISKWKVGFFPRAETYHTYNRNAHLKGPTFKSYLTEFYSTSLFLLKKPHHGFPFMCLYVAAFSTWHLLGSFFRRDFLRCCAILLSIPRIIWKLPVVLIHRIQSHSLKGPYLSIENRD